MRFVLAFALASTLLAACSGGGLAKPPTPGPTPTRGAVAGTDTEYMRQVCRAFGRYLTDFGAETQRDPNLFSDQAKLLRVAAPILANFARDLDKAKPPKDMANYHDALVERVKTSASKAKGGLVLTSAELGNFSKDAPLPPVTVRERIAEAASSVPECAESGGADALFGDTEGR